MLAKIKKTLAHLFIPHENNNWKPKYLHSDFLTYLIAVLLIINLTFKFILKNVDTTILGITTNLSIDELLNYTNAERLKYGLTPLKINDKLMLAAKDKASDMFNKNYWAHFAPDGTSPWYFFEKNNYQYLAAGENLAKDFTNSEEVVRAWMSSEKHRENILKPEYQEIGLAISEGELLGQPTVLIVQLFGKPEIQLAGNNSQQENNFESASSAQKHKSQLRELANLNIRSESIEKNPLIDLSILQKEIVFLILSGLIFALVVDLYFMEKKQVFRISGKRIAQLIFTLFIIFSILFTSGGAIL